MWWFTFYWKKNSESSKCVFLVMTLLSLNSRFILMCIMRFSDERIVCELCFTETIITISLEVERMLSFSNWSEYCMLSLFRKLKMKREDFFLTLWLIKQLIFFESFLNMITTDFQSCRKSSNIISVKCKCTCWVRMLCSKSTDWCWCWIWRIMMILLCVTTEWHHLKYRSDSWND